MSSINTKTEVNVKDAAGIAQNVLRFGTFIDDKQVPHSVVVIDPSGARTHGNLRIKDPGGNKYVILSVEAHQDPDDPTEWDFDVTIQV